MRTCQINPVLQRKMMLKKKAQEEMMGFAIIVVLVSIIILVVIAISIRKPDTKEIKSYKVESFIQSFLQYTTDCRDNLEFLTIRKLILNCIDSEKCTDGRESCAVLENTLKGIIKEGWLIDGSSSYKGYLLNITSGKESILLLREGNITKNYKGALQEFSKRGKLIEIIFNIYS